jgi:hypothetical protein
MAVLQSTLQHQVTNRLSYSSIRCALVGIWKHEGIAGFYRVSNQFVSIFHV